MEYPKYTRAQFLKKSSLGLLASQLPFSSFEDKKRMGIVVHSYSHRYGQSVASNMYPAFENALELLNHCAQLGGGGIQVGVKGWATDFAKKIRLQKDKLGLYLEGSIAMPKTKQDVPAFEKELQIAKDAGIQIMRTVSLGGRRYEVFKNQADWQVFQVQAKKAIDWVLPYLKKYKMKLAIENHKDWRADELVQLMKHYDSPWLGVTLDFGNSLALLENPMDVAQKLAPYTFTCHIKDMAVNEYEKGFLLSEVPMGQGFIDLKSIIALCQKYNPNVQFNLEMITRDPLQIPCFTEEYWASFDSVKAKELAATMLLVKSKKSNLPTINQLNYEGKLAKEEQNIIDCFLHYNSI